MWYWMTELSTDVSVCQCTWSESNLETHQCNSSIKANTLIFHTESKQNHIVIQKASLHKAVKQVRYVQWWLLQWPTIRCITCRRTAIQGGVYFTTRPDCLYGILAVFSVSSSGNPSRHHFLIILLLKHLIKQILCQWSIYYLLQYKKS